MTEQGKHSEIAPHLQGSAPSPAPQPAGEDGL
jgi:hypothetical protein